MPTPTLTTTDDAGLDHVVDRLAHDATVSRERARQLMAELFDFLDAAAGTGAPQRPSPAIDQAWHTFILHTRDYAAFCQDRYGRFIHHIPELTSAVASASDRDADCKSGESSCESEGNCTADCKSDDTATPDATPTDTSAHRALVDDPMVA